MKYLIASIILLTASTAQAQWYPYPSPYHRSPTAANGFRAGNDSSIVLDSKIQAWRAEQNEAFKYGDQRILKNRQAYLKAKNEKLKKEKQKAFAAKRVKQ